MKKYIGLFLCFLLALTEVVAQKVMIIKIREEINPQMAYLVALGLTKATEEKADYILIDMNTYGGTLTDADSIRTAILDYPKPVFAFINKNAFSAGALISLACDSIYMAPGSNIGAATVVNGEGKPAPDKYQAGMRGLMRTTAEINNRNPQLAESMVGYAVGTDSNNVGRVTVFTTSEAIKNSFCEAQLNSIQELLLHTHLDKAIIITFEMSTVDEIIIFFMNPVLRGLLLLLIIGGIYFELQSPGFGLPLVAAVIGTILYFVPSYLNGLAENWEIIIFFLGAILLILELTVIPGFGVAGISGIILIVSSLILTALNNTLFDFTFVPEDDLYITSATVLLAFTTGITLVFVAGSQFMKSNLFSRVSLQETFQASDGYTSNFNTEPFIGKQGTSYSVLRPSGKIMIDGSIYDAYSRGEYIEQNKPIEVIEQVGSSLKVKEIHV